ncbi:MAG: glycosyltransferase [Planctomycetota bacterium]
MRVLLFSNLFPSSTAPLHGVFVKERMDHLAAHVGFEYQVLHPLPGYPPLPGSSLEARHSHLPRRERVGGVEVRYPRYFHVPRLSTARQAARMRRGVGRSFAELVAEFGPDLVDAQYLYPDACAAIPLAREHGLPSVATARGSDLNVLARVPGVRRQLEEILPRASRCLAVSPELAEELERIAGLAGVLSVPNGVDLERFRPGGAAPLRRVVCVGRLVEGKAQDLLVRALAEDARIPELVLVGDGPERGRLERLAEALHVKERVSLRGELPRDEVARELGRGGVFAFPSRTEGWPNAVLEALASGMVVLACPVGGMQRILNETGRLLPLEAGPGDWARALGDCLRDLDENAETLRSRARRRAEQLSWDRSLEVLAGVYRELLA